jgi:hypothetical protein
LNCWQSQLEDFADAGFIDQLGAPCDEENPIDEDGCQGSTASILARIDHIPTMCEGVEWDTVAAPCLGDFDGSGASSVD